MHSEAELDLESGIEVHYADIEVAGVNVLDVDSQASRSHCNISVQLFCRLL